MKRNMLTRSLRGKAGGRSQSLDDISPSLCVAASSPLAIHRHLSGGQQSRARPCDQHLRGKTGGRSQSLDDISPSLRVAASSPLAIHRQLSGAAKRAKRRVSREQLELLDSALSGKDRGVTLREQGMKRNNGVPKRKQGM